jgi:hypothetical protein
MHGTKVPTRGTGRDPLSTGLRTLIVESGDASNAWLELATYLAALPEAYDVTWDSRISLFAPEEVARHWEMLMPPDCGSTAKKNAVAEVATDVFVFNRPGSAGPRAQLHVRCPCGSGCVQFWAFPSFVITTFAVAEPSYVITSRRIFVAGASLPTVTVTFIERVTEPAVG